MPRSFLVKKKRGASGGWQWKDDGVPGEPPPPGRPHASACSRSVIFISSPSEGGTAEEPEGPPPAPPSPPAAPLECVAALRVPVMIAGAGRPGPPAMALREYSYHPSTLALSRAKVTSLSLGGTEEEEAAAELGMVPSALVTSGHLRALSSFLPMKGGGRVAEGV